jgi:hypothetical protein
MVDSFLEATVVGSFTRIAFRLRVRMFRRAPPRPVPRTPGEGA